MRRQHRHPTFPDDPRYPDGHMNAPAAATPPASPGLKLIAIDLDGTLLDPEERISERNRAAIARVRAAGAEVVLVTARGFHRARPFALELGLSLPVLCCGGALVADSVTGNTLVHRPLPAACALPILRFALDRRLLILVHYDGHYFAHPDTIAAYADVAALVSPPWSSCADLDDLVRLGSTFLRALGNESVAQLRAAFETEYAGRHQFVELTWRGLADLGVYDVRVSKGNTLRAFCQERGIEQEEVMAIGDNVSDASMFAVAGVKVAMANADRALKGMADYVTQSNGEDGVAVALDHYLGGNASCMPAPNLPRPIA